MLALNPPYATGDIAIMLDDDGAVLHLAGEIDGGAVSQFERSAGSPLAPVVAVHGEDVTFMSSSGVGLLARLTEEYRRAGGRPILRRPSRSMQLVLGITGVDQLFDVRS